MANKNGNNDKRNNTEQEEAVEMVRFGGRGSRKTEFRRPTGVAVSQASEIFIADCLNERVVVCNTRGKVVRTFDTAVKGIFTRKSFRPNDVAFDRDGNLWVVGTIIVNEKDLLSDNLLAQFSTEGRFLTKIDLPLTGVTSGVATRADIGHVRVQDQSKGKAVSKKKKGGEPKKSEEENDGLEQYTNVVEIVVTDQRTRIVERKGHSESCVKVVTPDGTQVKVVGPRNTRKPTGVAVNQKGDLYVTDSWLHCVHVFMEGRDVTKKYKKFGGFGSGDGQLDSPHGICLDRQGNVIVVDRGNWRVSVFDRDGKFVRHIITDMADPCAVAIGPNFLVVTCVGHCGTDTVTIIPYSH
ncbi:PREDICTED: tripartite motif-containing protein 3-like [Branchiostoma belcheri]|uniref:Tripartite motif-containing protein 3-like n=1 Tax=Branchiostoma belcheri TaxID=7741 RepID=A0A6P5A003_BRABE|nr:PREDICTED: tripartite motif-containing protein 3-like [Branchiostoma belcheri]